MAKSVKLLRLNRMEEKIASERLKCRKYDLREKVNELRMRAKRSNKEFGKKTDEIRE